MRQLADQGFLPNRARLIVASFLTALDTGELGDQPAHVGATRVEPTGLPDRVEHAVRASVVPGPRDPLPVADVVASIGGPARFTSSDSWWTAIWPQGDP